MTKRLLGKLLLASSLVLGVGAATGCGGPGYYSASVTTTTPRMVWVEPGIWVVENSAYPLYYSDGYYWRYYGNTWYRSPYYDGSYVRVHSHYVPRTVATGYRPYHARYRAPQRAYVRPIVRDHRSPRRVYRR